MGERIWALALGALHSELTWPRALADDGLQLLLHDHNILVLALVPVRAADGVAMRGNMLTRGPSQPNIQWVYEGTGSVLL